MSHTLTQIWTHAIWSTQDRLPLIKPVFMGRICTHLRYKFQEMGCPVRIINGTEDHMHALFQLNHNMPLTRLMDTIKGNSSRWINQQQFLDRPFAWQAGYCALSVSGSMAQRVENFIRDQEVQHQKMSFPREYRYFLTRCGFAENQQLPGEPGQSKRPFPVTGQEIGHHAAKHSTSPH